MILVHAFGNLISPGAKKKGEKKPVKAAKGAECPHPA